MALAEACYAPPTLAGIVGELRHGCGGPVYKIEMGRLPPEEECQLCFGSWSREGGGGGVGGGRRGRSKGRGTKLLLHLETRKASQRCHLNYIFFFF